MNPDDARVAGMTSADILIKVNTKQRTFLQFHSLVSQSQREFWVLESKPTLPIGCYTHTKWFSTVPKSIHKNKKTQPPISLTCEDKWVVAFSVPVIVKVKVWRQISCRFFSSGRCESESVKTNELSLFQLRSLWKWKCEEKWVVAFLAPVIVKVKVWRQMSCKQQRNWSWRAGTNLLDGTRHFNSSDRTAGEVIVWIISTIYA